MWTSLWWRILLCWVCESLWWRTLFFTMGVWTSLWWRTLSWWVCEQVCGDGHCYVGCVNESVVTDTVMLGVWTSLWWRTLSCWVCERVCGDGHCHVGCVNESVVMDTRQQETLTERCYGWYVKESVVKDTLQQETMRAFLHGRCVNLAQFKMVSMSSEKPICALPVSQKCPQRCFWNTSNVRMIDDGLLSSFKIV